MQLRRYLRHGMLPQLAAFEAVMRLGSFTLAAEAMHMAQPTLSGHMRKLSDAVGVPLFRMRGRQKVPTAAAHALLDATDAIFAALQHAEDMLQPMRATPLTAASRPALRSGSETAGGYC